MDNEIMHGSDINKTSLIQQQQPLDLNVFENTNEKHKC